jgi:hypothetical protein
LQRLLHQRQHGDDGDFCRARQEDIGLVRDAERIAAGANGLEHGRGIGRQVATHQGQEQAGMVRVGIPIERHAQGAWLCLGAEASR